MSGCSADKEQVPARQAGGAGQADHQPYSYPASRSSMVPLPSSLSWAGSSRAGTAKRRPHPAKQDKGQDSTPVPCPALPSHRVFDDVISPTQGGYGKGDSIQAIVVLGRAGATVSGTVAGVLILQL